MPTTNDEAQQIIGICLEYLPAESLYQLFSELWDTVGVETTNESVRESLRMMKHLVAKFRPEVDDTEQDDSPCAGGGYDPSERTIADK